MAGDLVLSQDVDSGELTYRPVLSTTIRPPSPVRRIRVGDEVITATAGHPFWVAGHGWQMAKFLRAGDLIHGLAGSWPIPSADEAGEQEAYNLVVGDFHSYFVGEHGLLVHDNQLRQPTRAILPGYRPDVQERDAEGGTDHRR